ncbi:MAG: hypothetical protein A3G39_07280 [Deltaproteobacteria bacterium RIFCSPLOWO2_12_FULL_43_16]|nr:MAG: hypothetical protein A3D30_01200 [Deltaproteobacteria bacterium RIFCSPHIGHO2_02_FULL_43_33]OGQ57069.1 MAG: hypothetical protein A3G39_07280 [Deltaproteobacteria bacterium RIFCSPLOWO2_12_FULL_43_16]
MGFIAFLILSELFLPQMVFSEDAPSEPPANPNLTQGITDFRAENYEEALASFQKARKEEPSSSIAAYYLGLTYKQIQNYKEATFHLTDAVSLRPGVKEARLDLAEVYYNMDLNEESLKQLKFAEELDVRPAHVAFLKGLVLMKLNKNQEAVDEFKKAKTLDPSLTQTANLQLGVALIKAGQREEAGRIFKEVIVADPNSDMAQFANQYLEAMTRKPAEVKPFKITLNAKWEYDDNVILKPSDQTVAGGISGEHDTRYVGILRAEYTPAASGPFNVKTQYSAYSSDYQKLGSYDVMSHTLSIIPGYTMQDSMVNLFLSYNYTWVDDDEYMRTGTASPTYTFMFSDGQMGQAALRWQGKEILKPPFTTNEDRDSQDFAASLGWFYFFAGNRGFVNAKYEINREDTDGINWEYTGNKGNLNIVAPLADNLKLNLSGETYYQQFEYVNTNFLKKRRDITYTGSAMLAYELFKDWEVQLQYTYTRDDSNLAIYDYHKNVTSVGIEARF